MKILQRLRNRSRRGDAGDPGSAEASSEADQLPIPGYDQLDDKKVGAQLAQLSQVELAAVETYERPHKNRPEVLDKLRYMRTTEPLPGYDALSPEQIATALAGADAETVKAVRDYERKFGHRKQVMDEAARVLPTSRAGAGEERAREEKDARVREGLAGRQETAGGHARGRSAPPAGRGPMSTVRQPLKRERPTSTFERVEAARDEREQLREEARYRRERLALYRARLYGGRAARQGKLRELQRASDGAAARLGRAEAKAPPTRPPA
jgi:hypothetical protein